MVAERRGKQTKMDPENTQQWKSHQMRQVFLVATSLVLLIVNLIFFINMSILKSLGYALTSWISYLPLVLTLISIILLVYVSYTSRITARQFKLTSTTEKKEPPQNQSSVIALPIPSEKLSVSPQLREKLVERTSSPSIFLFNKQLTDPREFFGRRQDRTILIDRTRQGVSTSIVGPLRIGKTWLMRYLQLIAPTELGTTYRVGYLDATLPSCSTVSGFVYNALEALNYPLQFNSGSIQLKLNALESAVKGLVASGEKPVLCIDEFQGFLNDAEFDIDFFNGLRAITVEGLVLITASKAALKEIISDNRQTSPLFNVFQTLELAPFTSREAEEFVKEKGNQAQLTAEEQTFILDCKSVIQSNGSMDGWPPIFLQLTGLLLLGDKQEAENDPVYDYHPDDLIYRKKFKRRLKKKYSSVT